MDLASTLKRVNEARKEALASEHYLQQSEEHVEAIEKECCTPSTMPKLRRKTKPKRMSDLYSGNANYPMY